MVANLKFLNQLKGNNMKIKLFCVMVMCLFLFGCTSQSERLKGVESEFPQAEIREIPDGMGDKFIVRDTTGKVWYVGTDTASAKVNQKSLVFEVSVCK